MRPEITLDGDALRANAAAFAALGAPVAAVVKHDGYGWGARRLVRELDAVVDSYVVADADELASIRPATRRPVRLLQDARPGRLGHVLDLGGIPNVSSRASLAEAAAEAARRGPFAVRVGVIDAALWAAVAPADARGFADAVADAGLDVELWTHVTGASRAERTFDTFLTLRAAFAEAGVRVVSCDAASTASARAGTVFDRVRVGVGLFGAALGAPVALRCAVRVRAPVVRRLTPAELEWAGYGDVAIPPGVSAVVLRCGYGDGFPAKLADGDDILSIGMQYVTRADRGGDAGVLIGADADLDALARRAEVGPHAFVTSLGAATCGAST
jgi:alanine racemase